MACVLLPLADFLTSILSGTIGMGGGMLLLAIMFSSGMSHGEIIPVHAAVQLISNATRTIAFLRHVDWATVARFLIGVLPGGVLGVFVLVLLGDLQDAEPWLKTLVGVYILTSVAVPVCGAGRKRRSVWWDFPLLGLAAGAAAYAVGAVGPLIAPLFARRDFVKERLVATKAVCQSLLHIVKIPVFVLLGRVDDSASLGAVTLLMALAVIPGTLVGKRLLRAVSAARFVSIYRIALIAAGAKVLLLDGIWAIARSP